MTAIDTKTRILDAAEKLFADKGFRETSLRNITAEAGANLAAVNYHYGSKEALIQAVFGRFLGPINEARLELLDELEEAGEPDLEQIVRAFLRPVFGPTGLNERRVAATRLVGRAWLEGGEIHELLAVQFGELLRRFVPHFRRLLPHLQDNELIWRFHFMVGAMSHSLMNEDRICQMHLGQPPSTHPTQLIEMMVSFATAGFAAPASMREPSSHEHAEDER